jgi:ribosomal protein S18 acetylase RimI-like enzyme
MQDQDEIIQSSYTLSDDITAIDWWRLAHIYAEANLFDRKPFDIARAFNASYASVFMFNKGKLVGAARAVSDGVFYATVFDVCIDPAHQGEGAGRLLMEGLLAKLPFERIFLTSVPDKKGFYGKLGFLTQTNAMGLYSGPALDSALQRGVLVRADG